jgi:signal transduction histidine kinase/CheY-like chemotaxis protein
MGATEIYRTRPVAVALITAAFAFGMVMRLVILRRFDQLFARSRERWLLWFTVSVFTNAATWGLMSALIQWDYPLEWTAHAVGLVTVGAAAGGMATQSTHVGIQRTFISVIILPMTFALLLSGRPEAVIVGLVFLVYPAFLIWIGSHANREYWAVLEHEERLESKTLELKQALDKARAADRAKSDFLSRMSHELRTPLNAILGYAQLLKMGAEGELNPGQLSEVEHIYSAGDHLLSLIKDILDLSRIEGGGLSLNREWISVDELVRGVERMIRPLAERYRVRVDISQCLSCASRILGDRTRTRQVLLNLMSNAVKYNRTDGGGTVVLECRQGDDDRLRINVRDNGPGISEGRKEELFKAFSRLGAEVTEVEGTGIGLVITKRLIELMEGEVGFESRLGEGSSFWFELPEAVANDNHRRRIEKTKPSTTMASFGAGLRVLYIEDNVVNMALVVRLIERHTDLEVLSATRPEEGLELARRRRPDLILLDISLPGMDGFEVLSLLREREETRSIPVIAVSANAMEDDIARAKAAGFDDYLTKPIRMEGLLGSMKDWLSVAGPPGAGPSAPSTQEAESEVPAPLR